MTFANGQIPTSALTRTTAGVLLRADAAASYERLAKEFNKAYGPMYVSDGYRDRTEGPFSQEAIFRQRYRAQATGSGPFGDVRWWNGRRYVRHTGAAAAVPGTSNHGWGVAADFGAGINASFTSPAHRWMAQHGPSHGWTNTEGRSVNEPWHWVYDPARDQHRTTGGGGSTVAPTPAPPTSEEDDMTPEQSAKLDYIFNAIAPGESGVRSTGHVLVQLTRIENAVGAVSKAVSGVATSVKDVATAVGKIPTAVWGYRNAALEKVDDAYALLRKAVRK